MTQRHDFIMRLAWMPTATKYNCNKQKKRKTMYTERQNKERVSRQIDVSGVSRQAIQMKDGRKYLQTNFPHTNLIQFLLPPKVKCAINELRDDDKRNRFFTPATRNWYNENHPNDGTIETECRQNGQVQYVKNPRTVTANNRDSLIAALNAKYMKSVEEVVDNNTGNLILVLQDRPLLPIKEFTFLLRENTFHIAPNSQNSKFVHPNILGGWPEVDSAGTLEMNSKYIKVTNDSGHYQPDQIALDTAHRIITRWLGNPDNKSTERRKYHRLHIRENPKYKKTNL